MQVIEEKMGEGRVAKSLADIQNLAKQILSGDLTIDLVVSLLGGRRSSIKRARNILAATTCGNGRQGEVTGHFAVTDITNGMAALGEILGVIIGDALGGVLGDELGFGLESLVYDAMEVLDIDRTRFLIEEVFQKIRLHAQRSRTRTGMPPMDIGRFVLEVRADWFAEMRAEVAAVNAARADALLNSVGQTGAGKTPTAQQTAATAKAAADAAAAAAAAGGQQPGTPTTYKKKTGAERRKEAIAKAVLAATSPGAAAAVSTPAAGTPKTGTPNAGKPAGAQPQPGQTPPGGGTPNAAPSPTFAPNSIVLYLDIQGKRGAVETFDYLTWEAYPGTPKHERPCAFEAFAKCAMAPHDKCKKCRARAALTNPVPVPAGAVAKVKAACDPGTAAKITN